MNWLKKIFRKCKHDYKFIRNIHGDEINQCGKYRSIWKCKRCGKIEYRYDLNLPLVDILDKFNDEYVKLKYEEWKDNNKEILSKITNDMINIAQEGGISYDIVLTCNEKLSDKHYFSKWLDENKLKYEFTHLSKNLAHHEIEQYSLHIRWNYRY